MRAWEAPLRIPTYPVGPAEPNPMFYAGREYQGPKGPVYPYPLLDRLGDRREDRTYRALWLENEYLKLSVLPEIGGRIFTAQDKTNGYDFFYRQRVIKPALIGMLGAWISGGVEWNVFHHHRATTFMPVQSAIAENADGSRTVWVGETEWRQRMRWVVGLTLRPGRSYVEAAVRMTNRTPLAHSMLYFSNPAVHANESYQVIFPPDVDWATYHAKTEFAPWPLARAAVRRPRLRARHVDLSWWKNHPYPISFFAYDYGHRLPAAATTTAGRPASCTWPITTPCRARSSGPGATGPTAACGTGILTDEDGPVHRAHGRRLLRQPARLLAGSSRARRRTVVHYWYPVRDMGGVKNANLEAAVNLEVKDGRARIAVNTTTTRRDARGASDAGDAGRLRGDGDHRSRRPVRSRGGAARGRPRGRTCVSPSSPRTERSWWRTRAARGRRRPSRSEVPAAARRPPRSRPSRSCTWRACASSSSTTPTSTPRPTTAEALRRDPGDARTNTAVGRLALRRGRFEEAEKHLTPRWPA